MSNFLFEPQTNIQVQPLSKRTPVTYMAYKFYLSKLAKQLELKYCHIFGKLATRPENCRSRSVVYLANWNLICNRTWGVCNCYLQRGAKFNFGPPLRGSVRSPPTKVEANLFWCALGQPLKNNPRAAGPSSELGVQKIGRPTCNKNVTNWPTDANSL